MKNETVEAQKELFSGDKSKLEKYCDLIVGKRGILRLALFESIMMTAPLPGALGLWLRSALYPRLLGACGKNVTFGANVTMRHPHRISIGSNVVIDDNCLLDAKGSDNRGIVIGDGVFLGRNSILSCKNGDITLEDDVNIGFNSYIFSASSVVLEKEALVAAYCYFVGGGHKFDNPEVAVLRQERTSEGIRAGAGTWFGAGSTILDGVTVGRRAIVGAGSVVNGDVPEYAIHAGAPARFIRDRRDSKS